MDMQLYWKKHSMPEQILYMNTELKMVRDTILQGIKYLPMKHISKVTQAKRIACKLAKTLWKLQCCETSVHESEKQEDKEVNKDFSVNIGSKIAKDTIA